jgi:hypothetical protein
MFPLGLVGMIVVVTHALVSALLAASGGAGKSTGFLGGAK